MKAMKSIIVAVAILGACSSAFAQDSLPISSTGALRAYAVTQTRNVHIQATSSTNDTSFFRYIDLDGTHDSSQLAAVVESVKPVFDMTDTSASAYLYLHFTDNDGNVLLQGSLTVKPVQNASGEWVVPAAAGKFELSLGDLVRIPLAKRVSFAYVIDANGSYHSMPVSDGTILFPTVSAGLRGGQVKVWFDDNTVGTFSTSTGKRVPVMAVSASLGMGIKDLLSFKNQTFITVTVQSTNRKGVIPTVEVVKSVQGNVWFDVATSDGKRPTRLWYRQATSDEWHSTTGVSWPQGISLPAGATYIVPEWNPSDFSEETRALNYGDTGKG
ncbi:MAG: hypothetical protein Q8L64_03415 [bacterium]|nr:hypothetical protein [bacterium]